MSLSSTALNVEPGSYVIAVSGGVDSMVLLHLMAAMPDIQVIVAHVDHGIRSDSSEDRLLVQEVSKAYQLPFYYTEARLGAEASEAEARKARYVFLREIQKQTKAKSLITAHHQDDVLETALLNLLRGTKHRGLVSLSSRADVLRPLLDFDKSDILTYAQLHSLRWREDSTNTDLRYLRNRIRHVVLPKLNVQDRQKLLEIIHETREITRELDVLSAATLQALRLQEGLDRRAFGVLPDAVAREVMARWLRDAGVIGYDHKMLQRLVMAAKTYATGKQADVMDGYKLIINKENLALRGPDR